MYTVEQWQNIDKEYGIEGMRGEMVDHLVGNYKLLKGKSAKRAYLQALYVLNNEFLPVAYLRSEPIARFETRLRQTIRQIEDLEGDRGDPDKVIA